MLFGGKDKTFNFQQPPFKPTGNEYFIINRQVEEYFNCGVIFKKKKKKGSEKSNRAELVVPI